MSAQNINGLALRFHGTPGGVYTPPASPHIPTFDFYAATLQKMQNQGCRFKTLQRTVHEGRAILTVEVRKPDNWLESILRNWGFFDGEKGQAFDKFLHSSTLQFSL